MQNAVQMNVFRRIVTGDRAVPEAGGNDRDFPLEGNEAFEDERHAAKRVEGARGVLATPEQALALAVIAHAARLQHALATKGGQCCLQIFLAVHGAKIGGRNAATVEEALLRQPVLRGAERLRRRIDRNGGGERLGCRHGHVLEFVGHDIAEAGEFGQRGFIVIIRDDLIVADLCRRTIGLGLQHDGAVVEAGCGHCQHAAELSAADNADGEVALGQIIGAHRRVSCPRCRHWALSMGYSATAADWRARHASSRSARSSSPSARTAAARSAALIAPALPMASVPTGMPAGIWTME